MLLSFLPILVILFYWFINSKNMGLKKREKKLLKYYLFIVLMSVLSRYLTLFYYNGEYYSYNTIKSLIILIYFVSLFFIIYCTILCKYDVDRLWGYTCDHQEIYKNITLKKVLLLSLPIHGLFYMIIIFGVLESFFANTNEWRFGVNDFITQLIIIYICIFIIAEIIICLISRVINYEKIIIFMSSITLCCYLQNAFINSDNFIDGIKQIYSYSLLALNMMFWIIVIMLPIIIYENNISARKYVFKGALFISVFLFLIQLAPLPYLFSKKNNDLNFEKDSYTELVINGDMQYDLSSESNVIVLIMDTFYEGYFEEYLSEHEECYDKLRDFTFYNNINTNSFFTAFSMPCLLTASDIDFSRSLIASNEESWNSANAEYFYSSVHDKGYSVMLYTDSVDYCGGAYAMQGKIDNLKEIQYSIETDGLRTCLAFIKLSCYKYLPFSLKDFFFIYDSEAINRYTILDYNGAVKASTDEWSDSTEKSKKFGVDMYNYDYYEGLTKGIAVTDDEKKIVFQHIFGMHEPYFSIDGDKNVTRKDELDICMEIIYEYMDQLMQSGIYDDTAIIITADHGEHELLTSDPVMLVKGFDSHGNKLRVNKAPGCLQSDLLPTVLDMLEIDYSGISGGISLNDLNEDAERIKMIRAYEYNNEYPPRPKCNAVGYSIYNCYREYEYKGNTQDIDVDNDIVKKAQIYDFWW